MIKKFEVELLEEAFNFIQRLDIKHRGKILQNMERAKQKLDPKLFKKLDREIWSLELSMQAYNTDYLHFGIKQTNKIQ